MAQDKHSLHSSKREEYVEYIFLAKLCSYGWSKDRFVEVARAQTDAFGYDVVLGSGEITRHVQLKASVEGGRTARQKISKLLRDKQSGCVIWLKINPDTLKPSKYGWFGGKPNEAIPNLGSKPSKHTKANAQGEKGFRTNHLDVSWADFTKLSTIEQVFQHLFGATQIGEN